MVIQVAPVAWSQAAARCLAIRKQVFVIEQGIDDNIEFDGRDPDCEHVLATDDGQDIGTARMLPDGHIGRVAVLPAWRGHNIGRALMDALCDVARQQGLRTVHLSSQQSAIGFYRQLGFVAHGDMHMEAGIAHQNMSLALWPH